MRKSAVVSAALLLGVAFSAPAQVSAQEPAVLLRNVLEMARQLELAPSDPEREQPALDWDDEDTVVRRDEGVTSGDEENEDVPAEEPSSDGNAIADVVADVAPAARSLVALLGRGLALRSSPKADQELCLQVRKARGAGGRLRVVFRF